MKRLLWPFAVLVLSGAIAFVLLSRRNREASHEPQQDPWQAPVRVESPVYAPPLPPKPPIPESGAQDSLIGLVAVPAESLPRFEIRASSAEAMAVTVYGRNRGWYLVGTRTGGRDWLHEGVVRRYFAIENVVLNKLNYLTESWDGGLRDKPESGAAGLVVALPPSLLTAGGVRRDVPARVTEATHADDSVWLKVEILEQSPCEVTGAPRILATGWIPVWSADGKPTAWYYPRGC